MGPDIKKTTTAYLEHLKTSQQASVLTLANYQNYLNKFAEWYKKNTAKSDLVLSDKILTDYSNYLKKIKSDKNQTLSDSTRNYYLIALRSYIKYLAEEKLISFDFKKIKLATIAQSPKKLIDYSSLEKLLNSPLTTNESDLIKKRDLAILNILIKTGLKVSEINLLRRQNFSTPDTISIKNSKGRTINFQLDDNTCQLINDYLKLRHDTDPALFISHDRAGRADKRLHKKNFALTPRSIQRIILRYGQLSGLKNKITPSYLRYLYGHQLLAKGENVNKVKDLLGHAHVSTTKLYE